MPITVPIDVAQVDLDEDKPWQIVLYNDPVNTFDHVIQCLMDVCDHSSMQAEQCATIAHTTGRCVVKKGTEVDMIMRAGILGERGLTTDVQQT